MLSPKLSIVPNKRKSNNVKVENLSINDLCCLKYLFLRVILILEKTVLLSMIFLPQDMPAKILKLF